MDLESWVPERITIIVLMKLDRILLDVSYKLLIFPDLFSSSSAVSALWSVDVYSSVTLLHPLLPALAGLELDLGSFFHYYSFTALASSRRINLQYQASAGGWCILYTPLTPTLVWLPLNPEWLPILPWRVFTHRWIWFWCCSGAEVSASAWLMKSHMHFNLFLKKSEIRAEAKRGLTLNSQKREIAEISLIRDRQ